MEEGFYIATVVVLLASLESGSHSKYRSGIVPVIVFGRTDLAQFPRVSEVDIADHRPQQYVRAFLLSCCATKEQYERKIAGGTTAALLANIVRAICWNVTRGDWIQ